MLLLYNAGLRLYYFAIYISSFFNKKAKLWITGRQQQSVLPVSKSIWFHFASLGEFEQGRPVLEQLKTRYPNHKIIITFFSPSGYEIRKHTPLADAVYYLPLDTAANAESFIDTVQPCLAVFTKYEYWYHYFYVLNKRRVPLFIISGIFRPSQIFFSWYGGLHRRMLAFVNQFFVQDEASKQLLQTIKVTNATVNGDTRFDRVWLNAQQPKHLPIIEKFRSDKKLFIAGSSWPADEKLLATLVQPNPDWKFIFAPHEIDDHKIDGFLALLPAASTIKYSQLKDHPSPDKQILIIDNIGMLSALYQYADMAYIGGGFGAGIHNTLEAAAFGIPVIFGPNYERFKEARDLITFGAAFSVVNEEELQNTFSALADETACGDKARTYVKNNIGATDAIVNYIAQNVVL